MHLEGSVIRSTILGVGATLAMAAVAVAADVRPEETGFEEGHRRVQLSGTDTTGQPSRIGVSAFVRDGRILSLYGRPMSDGRTIEASAQRFLDQHLDVFGITSDELREGIEYADGAFTKGLMYDHGTQSYRFTLLRYTQHLDDVPVFRSELKLLVRNTPGHPLVLANANLRPLGGLEIDHAGLAMLNPEQALTVATEELGDDARIIDGPELVIWAGVDTGIDVPTVAVQFMAERGVWPNVEDYSKYLYIVDAGTGRVLYAENQLLNVDVEGNVSGYTTDGTTADPCSTQSLQPMPYIRVNIGGTEVFADADGDFVLPNGGGDPVTVQSPIIGQWFYTQNLGGPDALLEMTVSPPGPANFEHNPTGEEFTTAEVNAYIQAQRCRDHVLSLDPDFPIFEAIDEPFRLEVNDSSSCNAFYQGENLLFLRAQVDGCPNTSYSSIIYHEYGHHLVARATGSQCQWGEGNSDCTAVIMTDEPELAFGFFGDCDTPLRNADNDCQYLEAGCSSCGGPCHNCGQLISGCLWSLRNNLVVTEPSEYRTVLGQLWIASLFLHNTGQEITPADTVNYLIADDDDGDIGNGTPHYPEIAAAFGDHSMPAPALTLIEFELPNGTPETVDPAGGTTIDVVVAGINGDPKPDSGLLYILGGGTLLEVPMVEVETNVYEATFPALSCGVIKYYFSVDTTNDERVFFPTDADVSDIPRLLTFASYGLEAGFTDDFEQDTGWSVVHEAGDGEWERGTPLPQCEQGNPPSDGDGSGQCYLTQNTPDSGCRSDVDNGTTTLTSPIMDASNPAAVLAYSRWYDTLLLPTLPRDDELLVEVSDDGGDTWTQLEAVGPEGEEAEGGWFHKVFDIADFVTPTDEFRVRFVASDTGGQGLVEAAVDGIEIINLVCVKCPEDLDGSGAVDFGDILDVLAAWGPCGKDCPEDLDDSGAVDFGDILEILAAWGPC